MSTFKNAVDLAVVQALDHLDNACTNKGLDDQSSQDKFEIKAREWFLESIRLVVDESTPMPKLTYTKTLSKSIEEIILYNVTSGLTGIHRSNIGYVTNRQHLKDWMRRRDLDGNLRNGIVLREIHSLLTKT